MPSFYRELKNRKVFRIAIAYVLTGWLVLQVAATVLPILEVPRWVLSAVVVLLALALPVVLVLSWAFSLTTAGIEREHEPAGERQVRNRRYRARLTSIGIAVAGIVVAAYGHREGWWGSRSSKSLLTERSTIAVLPFTSLSGDKENAYFADGIQDEIITRLTKIGSLRVISRGSTRQYTDRPTNLPEIARQLGASHLLQGTVQRVGEQVRVNVQLIDGKSDSHVWAESFDRKLTDLFAVESEIAEKVASSLSASLTGDEHRALAVRPTNSVAAYDFFLRGLAYERLSAVAPDTFQHAIRFYEQAVEADPAFAVAWAHLAVLHSSMYHFGFDHTPARLGAIERAAETAMRLQPELAEARLAWGYYQYRGKQDYAAAEKAADEARQRQPNDAWTIAFGAFVKRRQAKWEEAVALLEQVMQLDPRNGQVHSELGYTLLFTRNFKRAQEVAKHGLSVTPNDPTLTALSTTVYQAEGNLEAAERTLAPLPLQADNPTVFTTQMTQLLFQRRFEPAIAALTAALQYPDVSLGGQIGEYYVILSLAQQLAGDEAGARETCEKGIVYLEAMRANGADTWFLSSCIGLLRAGLGDEAGAMREGQHALELTGPDISAKPDVEEAIARMHARLGRRDEALAALPRLLRSSYQKAFFGSVLTPTVLRLDPAWDPLRADPRFQKLCE